MKCNQPTRARVTKETARKQTKQNRQTSPAVFKSLWFIFLSSCVCVMCARIVEQKTPFPPPPPFPLPASSPPMQTTQNHKYEKSPTPRAICCYRHDSLVSQLLCGDGPPPGLLALLPVTCGSYFTRCLPWPLAPRLLSVRVGAGPVCSFCYATTWQTTH